jgi:hypothetical protein
MAASGYTPIQLYRTSTSGTAPTSGNLTAGELAINYNTADMSVWALNTGGSVIRLMNNPAGLKYPTTDGTANQVMVTNGSGVLSWAAGPSGTYLPLAGGTMTGAITFAAGQTVDGTNGIGYINIPQNSQSAAYTLVAADAGKHIFHPSTDANARTFTIPANGSVAYPIGTAISFINMTSQVVSIAITTDTMYLAGTGSTTVPRLLAQYGTATALKIDSTTWIISGAGLT